MRITRVVVALCIFAASLVAGQGVAAAAARNVITIDGPKGFTVHDTSAGSIVRVGLHQHDEPGMTVSAATDDQNFVLMVQPAGFWPLTVGTLPVNGGSSEDGSLTHTACTAGEGLFIIHRLERGSTGAISAFSASFETSCAEPGGPVHGDIRYNVADGWQALELAPVEFSATKVGDVAEATATLTSTGTAPVTVGDISDAVLPPFAIGSDSCSGITLPTGSTCTVGLTFTPLTPAAHNRALTLPVNTSKGQISTHVAGPSYTTPDPPGALRVAAGDDGLVLAGGLSFNGGSPIVAVRVYADSGDGFGQVAEIPTTAYQVAFSYVDPLPPGTHRRYAVSAVSALAGEGPQSAPVEGTVPISAPAPGPVSLVALQWDGSSSRPGYAVAPTAMSFGTSYFHLATPISLGGITFASSDGAPWSPGHYRGEMRVGSGYPPACVSQTTLTVYEARIHIDGTPAAFAASADLDCGARLEIRYASNVGVVATSLLPDPVWWPQLSPGQSSAPQTITLSNVGTLPVDLGAASTPVDWPVTNDGCSDTTLAPGEACTLALAFQPVELGHRSGFLVIPDSSTVGRRRLALSGSSVVKPGPVTGLTATGLVGRTRLTWRAPTVGFPAADHYVVYRGTSPTSLTKVTPAMLSPTTALDIYGGAGSKLYYAVAAANYLGEGPRTTVEVVLPLRELLYAAAPTGSTTTSVLATAQPSGTVSRVTTGTGSEADVALSPDRTRVAFTRVVAGRKQLFIQRWNDTPTLLASGTWHYQQPSWSPDGKTLAFACRPDTQTWWDLCHKAVASSHQSMSRLRNGTHAWSPSWLPNSRQLLAVEDGGLRRVVVLGLDGRRQVVSGTERTARVAVSPDGSRRATLRHETTPAGEAPRFSVRVAALNGGTGTAIVGAGLNDAPSWTRDSARIIYTHADRRPDGTASARDVFSVPAAGGTPSRLTSTPDVDEAGPVLNDPSLRRSAPRPAPMADFTGDGRADFAVFRPGTGTWHIRGRATVKHGQVGDIPVPGDYNGDGKAEIAVFRPSTGAWLIAGSAPISLGRSGDVPVPADYNGDGRDEVAVFRPESGTWYIRGRAPVTWGRAGDTPVPADYNGDGRDEVAVYRPGSWLIFGRTTIAYGGATTMVPVPGDFIGTGADDLALLDAAGYWHVRGRYEVPWGVSAWAHSAAQPAWGNFSGDIRDEAAAFDSTTGVWSVRGLAAVSHGTFGDVPV